jgi:CRP-like cAMP-binding protein
MTVLHPECKAAKLPFALVPERWTRHPFLARLERFIALSEEERSALWRLIEAELTVKRHTELVVDGYAYRKLCFVEDGFAARYKLLRNGKRQIISLILPGDVIGLPGSFLERAGHSVVGLTDLKLQVCSINAYVDLCGRYPQFGLALSWLAVQEAITCAENVVNNGRRTPAERLAHFLLEIHARLAMIGRATDTGFDLPFSQEVMSDALGLSVPHLNRTLAKLRADGLLAVKDHHVELIERQALELLGHFERLSLMRIPSGSALAAHS